MPGRAARCARPGNTPGALGLEQAIDELAERLRHRPARAARPDRSEPGAARGAAHRRRADRLGAAARARRRSRAGEARPRRGAVALGRQCADAIRPARCGCCATARWRCCRACRTSAPASARCWRRSSPKSSGFAPEDDRRAHRRHRISRPGRPPTAAGPPPRSRRRRAPPPGASCKRCSAKRRSLLNAAPEDLIARDGRIVVRDEPGRSMSFARGGGAAAHGSHQRRRLAQRRLWRLSPAHGRCRAGAAGSRRRPVRRSGGRYRDRHRPRRARGRGRRIAAGR